MSGLVDILIGKKKKKKKDEKPFLRKVGESFDVTPPKGSRAERLKKALEAAEKAQ